MAPTLTISQKRFDILFANGQKKFKLRHRLKYKIQLKQPQLFNIQSHLLNEERDPLFKRTLRH
jgi:hypothetical protein